MINNLDKLILNGGSLDKDLQPIKKDSGFVVSYLGYEKTFNPDNTEEIEKTILEYQKKLLKNDYIGIWNNNGLIYIDISKHYENKRQAIKQGIKNKQLAIYDLKNKKDIELIQKTYILYRYNKILNDIDYVMEFTSIKDMENALQMNYKTLHHYIIKSIDKPIKELLNNKYLIIVNYAFIKDLEE